MVEQVFGGYIRLLKRIFGVVDPLPCRVCGCPIDKLARGDGNICLKCFRVKNRLHQQEYYRKNPERVRLYNKGRITPKANLAHVIAHLHYPVRQTCEIEGCNELGYRHHDDYNKPREIRWLCPVHHKRDHLTSMLK